MRASVRWPRVASWYQATHPGMTVFITIGQKHESTDTVNEPNS